jgi:hypothetical protein
MQRREFIALLGDRVGSFIALRAKADADDLFSQHQLCCRDPNPVSSLPESVLCGT